MKTNKMAKVMTTASLSALLLSGVVGCSATEENFLTVALDVNPSITLQVGQDEKVISVETHNADAQAIVADMDFTGSDIRVATSAIVGSMIQNGYITEVQNSILVSVDGEAKDSELTEELVEDINEIVANASVNASVLVQEMGTDEVAEEISENYDISEGKAQLINQIVAQDPTLKVEELTALTVNELNLLIQSGNRDVSTTVEQTGTPNASQYISAEQAQALALQYAGVGAEQATKIDVDFDVENGLVTYEVEIDTATQEFEVELNAIDGSHIKTETDNNDDDHDDMDDNDDMDDDNDDDNDDDDNDDDAVFTLTKEQAVAIAMQSVGATEANTILLDVEQNEDDNRAEYEVEFQVGNTKYTIDVDATTGQILETETDVEDNDDQDDDNDDDYDDYDDNDDDSDDDDDDDDDDNDDDDNDDDDND